MAQKRFRWGGPSAKERQLPKLKAKAAHERATAHQQDRDQPWWWAQAAKAAARKKAAGPDARSRQFPFFVAFPPRRRSGVGLGDGPGQPSARHLRDNILT